MIVHKRKNEVELSSFLHGGCTDGDKAEEDAENFKTIK